MNPQKIMSPNNKAKNNLNKMIMKNLRKINSPEFKAQISSQKVIYNRTKTLNSGPKIQEDFLDYLTFLCLVFT